MNRRKFLASAAAFSVAPQAPEVGRIRFRLTEQPELTLGMLQQLETRLKVEAMLVHQKFRQEKFFSIVNTEYYDATEKTV